VTVEVVLEERPGHTVANFTASLPVARNPEAASAGAVYAGNLERVAEMFAGGVSITLGRHGIRTTPRHFLEPDRIERLKRTDIRSKWLVWPLLFIGVAAFVAVLTAHASAHAGMVVLGVIMWLPAVIVTRVHLRSRVFGLSRGWAFYFAIILWLCVVLFGALALFLP
jgi:hypothetical protein